MMEAPYLCVLYVATAGQQGPGLGADEEEIVLLVYILIDMGQNKVMCFLASDATHNPHVLGSLLCHSAVESH